MLDVYPTPIETPKKQRFQALRRLFVSESSKRLTKKTNIVDKQQRDSSSLRYTGPQIVDPGGVNISRSYPEVLRPKTSGAYHEYSLSLNLDQQDNYGTQPGVPAERNAVRPSTSLGVTSTRLTKRPVPRSSRTQQNDSQSMGMNQTIWYPVELKGRTTMGSLAVPTSPSSPPPVFVDMAPTSHQPTTALPRASTIRITPLQSPNRLQRRVPFPSENADIQESLGKVQRAESERRRERKTREALEIELKAEIERERREWERRESERKNRERQLAELQERQRQAEQARRERERQEHARKQEERRQQQAALQAVGAHVAVRHVNQWGSLSQGRNVRDLTPAILKQMRIIKNSFAKNLSISKIEYIMNDALYNQFNATKAEFRKYGRNTKEMLLFHGTDPQNIDRFSDSKRY